MTREISRWHLWSAGRAPGGKSWKRPRVAAGFAGGEWALSHESTRWSAFSLAFVGGALICGSVRFASPQGLRTISKRPMPRSLMAGPKRLLKFHSGVSGKNIRIVLRSIPMRIERIAVSRRFRSDSFQVRNRRYGLLQATAAASKRARSGRIRMVRMGVRDEIGARFDIPKIHGPCLELFAWGWPAESVAPVFVDG